MYSVETIYNNLKSPRHKRHRVLEKLKKFPKIVYL